MTPPRIVLAFSGGLASACAVPWLADRHGAEIITITLDLGQGREHGELEDVRDRALAAGAVRAHVLDAREELARDVLGRAVKAGAGGVDGQLVTAVARPVIARRLAEIAAIEQAAMIAHGAGAPKDAARIAAAARAIAPQLGVLAPARDWDMTRSDLLEYARARRLATTIGLDPSVGVDATLWGRTACSTDADPPSADAMYAITKPAAECPAEPAYLSVVFERGAPITVNGIDMPLIDLVAMIGMIAAAHGVGRSDAVEPAAGGAVRRVCEAPAARVLLAAHAALQKVAIGARASRFSRRVGREYSELIDGGLWFAPLRGALDAYVDKTQERVSGTVRVKLFKGDCRIVERKLVQPRAGAKRLRVVARTH
jgi:argininosuccinate synthase